MSTEWCISSIPDSKNHPNIFSVTGVVGDRLTYDRDRLQQVLDSYPSRLKEKRMQDQTILANMYNSYKNNFANKIKFYPMAENLSMYNVH